MTFDQGSAVIVLVGEWKGRVATVHHEMEDGRILVHIRGLAKISRYYEADQLVPADRTRDCNRCHQELPLTAFPVKESMPLGRGYTCTRCHRYEVAETQRRLQEETLASATHHRQDWTEEEVDLLMSSGLTLAEIARQLGRTYAACNWKRHEIRKERNGADHQYE